MERKVIVAAVLGVVGGVLLALGVTAVVDKDDPADAAPSAPEAGGAPAPTTTEPTGLVDPPPEWDAVVFVTNGVTEADRAAVGDRLASHPAVARIDYYDREETMVEYEEIFCNNEAMLAEGRRNPELVPTSFRVYFEDRDDPGNAELLAEVEDMAAVLRVAETQR